MIGRSSATCYCQLHRHDGYHGLAHAAVDVLSNLTPDVEEHSVCVQLH